MIFDHDKVDKSKCWFKKICPKYKNDPEYCLTHDCIMNTKMNYLINYSLLSAKDKYPIPLIPDADGTDADKFLQLKEIQVDINDFVTEGKNLFIYSKITGNGKSAWAKKLLLSWFNSIVYYTEFECRGLYINLPRFFNEMKNDITTPSDYIQFIKTKLPEADLVIWDEIGIKNLTNWEHDILLSYINQRVENGKANIFTSNMIPEEIREKLGDRLYSRIIQMSTLIELNGKDKRALNK